MHKLFDIAVQPRINGTEELYYRSSENKISFDTYFNAIPIRKLGRYTSITELIFTHTVTICTEHEVLKTSDRILVSEVPDNTELLYIRADSIDTEISVYAEGQYSQVKTAIIICTYRREEQVKANVDYLLSHINDTDSEIILVDNDSFIACDTWHSDNVHVLHNINNGGSGGFAQGMKYAAEQNRFTHIILMDDDVTIDFVAIQKMLGFLAFLKDECQDLSIAGSMLYADKPTIQFESGGYFFSDGMQTGYGYHFDLTDRQKLIDNEKEKLLNYGGWWMFCMPIRYAAEGQLPAPFFIKYDDVEYALRCKLNIITLNGVGVWHEAFGSKYNSVQEYFNARNLLFLMKWHTPDFTPKKAYKKARYLLLEKLCRQQYKMAEAVIIAYEDFLNCEEYLTKINYSQKLAELKKLNYQMLSENEILQRYGLSFDEKLYTECRKRTFKRYMQPFLYGHLIPKFLCKKLTITDVLSDRKEHYFGANMTLHFDKSQEVGYVTERSLKKFAKSLIKLKRMKGN